MVVAKWKWKNGGRKQAFYPFGSYSRAFSSLSHISHDTFPLIAFFPCYKTAMRCDAMQLFFILFLLQDLLWSLRYSLGGLATLFLLFFSFSPSIPPPHTHTSMRKAIKRATISWTSSLEQEPLNIMKSCLYPRVYCAPRVSCLLFFLPLVQLLFFSPFHIKENPNTLLSPVVTSQTVPSSGLDTFFLAPDPFIILFISDSNALLHFF